MGIKWSESCGLESLLGHYSLIENVGEGRQLNVPFTISSCHSFTGVRLGFPRIQVQLNSGLISFLWAFPMTYMYLLGDSCVRWSGYTDI